MDLTTQPDSYLIETGGLHIIGSERHESRRIDRQLRGRAGRQGDPGASQFFLSLEDDLMRLFGSERIASIMDRLGAEEGEVITHPWITNSIGGAQKRVEMQNFEARKRLLDYDDVMNQQREVIYDLRTFALEGGEELKGEVWEMIERALPAVIDEYAAAGTSSDDWDLAGLRQRLLLDFFITLNISAALMIVVATMYVPRALDFSSFPTILLLTTLFRLAINIPAGTPVAWSDLRALYVVADGEVRVFRRRREITMLLQPPGLAAVDETAVAGDQRRARLHHHVRDLVEREAGPDQRDLLPHRPARRQRAVVQRLGQRRDDVPRDASRDRRDLAAASRGCRCSRRARTDASCCGGRRGTRCR